MNQFLEKTLNGVCLSENILELKGEILERCSKVFPANETRVIELAITVAENAHKGQLRKSGAEYVTHPLGASIIALELGFDYEVVAATILHDVLEDTSITSKELQEKFGNKITDLVEGVTKVSELKNKKTQLNNNRLTANQFRKMVVALAQDRRVLMVKIVDRLHNLKTIKYLDSKKAGMVGKETLDVYVPLAQRMGLGIVLSELEDLAFQAYNPDAYSEVTNSLQECIRNTKNIDNIIKTIENNISNKGNYSLVEGRHKSAYSAWRKSKRTGVPINALKDLTGVRIICNSKTDCYIILGEIHSIWKPVPGSFDDYIASPKYNNYQSLHTQIVMPNFGIVEVQIRSEEMHKYAESGKASHYYYKHGEDPSWVEDLIQGDAKDIDYVDNMKEDLHTKRVYVLTPKGDLIDLPDGSNVLDFAYAVHSEVGNRCAGAYIDGVECGKGSVLKSGDIVNIIKSRKKEKHASFYALYCKTSKARSGVRKANEHMLFLKSKPREFYYHTKLTCEDYPGVLLESIKCLYDNKSNIIASSSYSFEGSAYQEFEITSVNSKLLDELNNLRGVKRVEALEI
jgi:GTP pyrophosphokinase